MASNAVSFCGIWRPALMSNSQPQVSRRWPAAHGGGETRCGLCLGAIVVRPAIERPVFDHYYHFVAGVSDAERS